MPRINSGHFFYHKNLLRIKFIIKYQSEAKGLYFISFAHFNYYSIYSKFAKCNLPKVTIKLIKQHFSILTSESEEYCL